MERLHKKCVIASAGLHSLLVIILFVGPAFLSPNPPKTPDMPVLDFVPFETVDALMSGGGNPNANPPPAMPNVRPQPVVAAPPPPPAQERKAEPVKPEPEVRDPEPEKSQEAALEPSTKPVRKKPQINLKQVVRKTGSSESKAQAEARERAEREYTAGRKQLAKAIGSFANGIPGSISSGTTIELRGPGGGGIPYANFLQAVKSAYTHAWVLPEGVTDDDATVGTTVTIARDGSVVSAKITRRSGNAAVDASVRATLDRVTYAAPLPRDAKEDQRTVTINFNVRAKKLMG